MNALVLAITLLVTQDSNGGRLKKFEEPIREKKESKRSKKEECQEPIRACHDSCETDDSLLTEILAVSLLYPSVDRHLRFEAYPFAEETNYFLDQGDKLFAGEADVHYLYIDRDLFAIGASGTLRLPSGFDFAFDVTQYIEDVPTGIDRLTLSTFDFDYGPGGSERDYHWTVGWGIAVLNGFESHLGASLQAKFGLFRRGRVSSRKPVQSLSS